MNFVTSSRNFTVMDGSGTHLILTGLCVVNFLLAMLSVWSSHTFGYVLIAALMLVVFFIWYWKLQLDEDTLYDAVDWLTNDVYVFTMIVFICSEIMVFVSFVWIVMYSLWSDFSLSWVIAGSAIY